MSIDIGNYPQNVNKAVKAFWAGRSAAREKQLSQGRADQGNRSAVTGGKNLDAFVDLLITLVKKNGLKKAEIYKTSTLVTLPGYFRPTKKWDLLVVDEGILIAAIEFKSICGPSYGNNINNRCEEAIGSGVDFQTAAREGSFGSGRPPFLGFLMMIQDEEKSRKPVSMKSPHFETDNIFKEASYIDRLDILCSRLMREHHYDAACVISTENKKNGSFSDVSKETSIKRFLAAFAAKISESALL